MTATRSARLVTSGAFAAQGPACAPVLTRPPVFEDRCAISTGALTTELFALSAPLVAGA